jgi:hypothetical protein
VRKYALSTFVINSLIHIHQKEKIAAKIARVNEPEGVQLYEQVATVPLTIEQRLSDKSSSTVILNEEPSLETSNLFVSFRL